MHDGSIDILAVYDVSRFARKIGVADILLDEVFECGVQLYLVSWDSVVRDTIRDRKVFYDESIYADIDRRKILERTTDGKREKFKVSGLVRVSRSKGLPRLAKNAIQYYSLLITKSRPSKTSSSGLSIPNTESGRCSPALMRLALPRLRLRKDYHRAQKLQKQRNQEALTHVDNATRVVERYEEELKGYAELYARKLITINIMAEGRT